MSPRAVLVSSVVTVTLVLLAALVFELPLERAAVLAPVLVVIGAAGAGLVVLWARVGWESLQRRRHPWRVVALAAGAVVLLVALSVLGLRLPQE